MHVWHCAVDGSQGHQLFTPSFVPGVLLTGHPRAVVLMRLADYCSPSPLSTSAPFLSTRQPCRASVANPGQAGPCRTAKHTRMYTNTHLNTLSCALCSPRCMSKNAVRHTCAAQSPKQRQRGSLLLLLLLIVSHFLISHLRFLVCHQEALVSLRQLLPLDKLFP